MGIAHAVERVQGGGSLRLLLGRTRAATAADAVHERDGGEDGLVCRARRVDQLVRGGLEVVRLHAFLQVALWVGGMLRALGRQMRLKRTVDKLLRNIPATIQIHSAHQRLEYVLEGGMLPGHRCRSLRRQRGFYLIDPQLACDLGQRHTGNQRHLKAVSFALVKAGIRLEQGQRDDGAKYGIAQKLQAFAAKRDGLPSTRGWMW